MSNRAEWIMTDEEEREAYEEQIKCLECGSEEDCYDGCQCERCIDICVQHKEQEKEAYD